MARPRSFNAETVVEAAKEVFWKRGYEGSAISDLEHATGLNRSSLYGAFGSKEELFDRALGVYIEGFVRGLLGPMEDPRARPQDVEGFFRSLAALFRADTMPARHGCLWVNSIAEFVGRDGVPAPDVRATQFRERLHGAFGHALRGTPAEDGVSVRWVERRARILVSATFGIWLTARIDAAEAALLCDAVIEQARSWWVPAGDLGH
jgi:TetR/AcrR family transcriptional repressor of nem operon